MDFYSSAIFLVYILSGILTQAGAIKGDGVTLVEEGEYSYVVSIAHINIRVREEQTHICTGVLIERNFVLTVAHCLKERSPNQTEIIAGSVDLREGEKYNISMWITYEQWAERKGMTFTKDINDIAVIKLTTNVYRRIASPAILSFEAGYYLDDDNFDLVGWGFSNESPEIPSRYLHKARAKALTKKLCENIWYRLSRKRVHFPEEFFCSKGTPNAFVDCGDSGGPVVRMNRTVVGLSLGTCPTTGLSNTHINFINDHNLNVHANLASSQLFIYDILNNY